MKHIVRIFVALFSAVLFPAAMNATEIEATLKPLYTHPGDSRHFVAPLEEVGFIFDRCIKLYDEASVIVKCDGKTVASATGYEVDNYDGELGKQGCLIARFDKQNLPKGKTYTISLAKGSVGWVERYNDIQIVNRDYTCDIHVPENLGTPETNHVEDGPCEDLTAVPYAFIMDMR